jgi:hypothetical protein
MKNNFDEIRSKVWTELSNRTFYFESEEIYIQVMSQLNTQAWNQARARIWMYNI